MKVYLFLGLVSLFSVDVLFADDPPPDKGAGVAKPLFTVSKETTHITEPLTKDGRVDYFAAFDNHMRRDVTIDNNAGVLIVRAVGPDIAQEPLGEDFFQRLEIEELSLTGKYFLSLQAYLEERGLAADLERLQERRKDLQSTPWKSEDELILSNWIDSNQGALALIVEASKREKFYIPPIIQTAENNAAGPAFISMKFPAVKQLRAVTQALTLRSMMRLGKGDVDSAFEDVWSVHRLAHLAGQSPFVVMKIYSYAMDANACFAQCAIARHGGLSKEAALNARARIEAFHPVSSPRDAYEVGERFSFLDTAQTIAYSGTDALSNLAGDSAKVRTFLGSLPVGVFINYDVTLKMGNATFDRLAEIASEPDAKKRRQLYFELEEDLVSRVQKTRSPRTLALSLLGGRLRDQLGETMGNLLLSMLIPSFNALHDLEMSANTYRDFARLSYALAAYEADHQQFPADLNDLAGEYIKNVPEDRFSQQPLHYKREGDGYLLYSVGRNQRDDAGERSDRPPRPDDLAVRHGGRN